MALEEGEASIEENHPAAVKGEELLEEALEENLVEVEVKTEQYQGKVSYLKVLNFFLHFASRGTCQQTFALIIDGKSLTYALEDNMKNMFLELASHCASVICCRSSPKQKALVTRLVKSGTGKTTLAIGDGANDVGMLQEADVGIGISGVEGMQAVIMSSDIAIAQFKYLERLLLVHGHWCYRRMSPMICYFFFKNITFGFTLFYSVFFSSLPVIALGVLDQDVSARYCLKQLSLRPLMRREEQPEGICWA
ncbi:hypothetical protein LR48_Vigan04g048500 [Vigna angularis]|uniref:P-type ATPase C-terminal domain-containing protein n=1 Tax=Phaseolus angularis TaxID=3914 RepID=A0A0L9UCK2_PHAAN|nr:hypothetical protein LR48_Vigan04g048500 [Vigna angularis]